jgi:DNA polymerase III subunit alpha
MQIEEIRKQILSEVQGADESALKQIDSELDFMEVEDGLDGRSLLEGFYDTWERRKKKKKKNKRKGKNNAINSITAYYIGMTAKFPDGEFLLKRRAFARAGFPDIDSDFEYFRRQEIYDYIIDKYGRENVGNIGTYGGLKLKSAIRRIGKALDVANAFFKGSKENKSENEAKVSEIVASLPRQIGAILKVADEDGVEHKIKTIEDAYKYCSDFKAYIDKFEEKGFRNHAKLIEGIVSNFGVHAAGVVISNVPLHTIAPLRTSNKGFATQFPNEDLESMGLIKFDILAISTLSVIKKTVEMVKQNYDIDIDIKNLPLDDKNTFDLYKSGKLTGIFQCENRGMQETIQEIEVDCFNDIMAAIALYRPGPMVSIPEYCARKKGFKTVDFFHPVIEKHVKHILDKTYGVLVFQEQVMQICKELAGFSETDGYVLIKGIGKKKQNLIDKYKGLFIKGAVERGLPERIADDYWEKFITPFAAYGFNAAHSCCYAYDSYMTAYLKSNYTDEFMCAYMNIESTRKKYDKVKELERDCKKFDIKILPKKLNSCGVEYKIIKKKDGNSGVEFTEIMPSIVCEGVGIETATELAKNAPYDNLRDIAFNTDTSKVDLGAIRSLAEAGFFNDEFKELNKKLPKGQKIKKQDFAEMLASKFGSLRKDMKASAKRGVGPESLF